MWLNVENPDDSAVYTSASGVAVYQEGKLLVDRQDGVLSISKTRLTFRNAQYSIYLPIPAIVQVDYKPATFTGSPKIVIMVSEVIASRHSATDKPKRVEKWRCEVCEEWCVQDAKQCEHCGSERADAASWWCEVCELENFVETASKCQECGSVRENSADEDGILPKVEQVFTFWLSFRKDSPTKALNTLRTLVAGGGPSTTSPLPSPRRQESSVSGVTGLLRRLEVEESRREESLDAFGDVSDLMRVAKDLVALAETVARTVDTQGDPADEDKQIRAMLRDMGLGGTVFAVDGSSLPATLATFVRDRIFTRPDAPRSLLLVDLFCLFNRAAAYPVSPNAVAEAAAKWLPAEHGIQLRILRNGVAIVQSSAFSDGEIVKRLLPLMQERGLSIGDIARLEGLPGILAEELVEAAEHRGLMCRDESPLHGGTVYYPNRILRL